MKLVIFFKRRFVLNQKNNISASCLIDNVEKTAVSKQNEEAVHNKKLYLFVKRSFDIFASLLIGTLILIPMLIVALVIRIESHGPAIFKQQRVGKDGRVFTIYKFRSMRTDAPSEMATRDFVNSADYVTKFGAFIRRTSIDELPQLINILNGTMSFVGYRPVCLTEEKLNELRKEYGVFSMRPGLTGLAQIKGRDNVTVEEKVLLDAEYVQKSGVKLDLWCILKTIVVVLSGEGAK